MRTTAAAATIAGCLALAACGGDGMDERFPSLGPLPVKATPMPTPPAFARPMGESNIRYGDVVMDGICAGVITVKNSLDKPAGIEAEVEFYRDDRVVAVRRYAWWPAKASQPLPTERALRPGETALMELTNDAIDGYNGPFPTAPTGCRVTAAHIQADPQPRPCEEKHGTGCPAVGRAWARGAAPVPPGAPGARPGSAPSPARVTTTVTVLQTAPAAGQTQG